MFQLFQKSFDFAVQELQERCWFWYKTCFVVFLKVFCVTIVLTGVPVFCVVAALGAGPYLPQNYAMAWFIVLWGCVAAIVAFCAYHFVVKTVELLVSLMATTLAGAHDEKPTKLVSVSSIASFLQLFLILLVAVIFVKCGQRIIIAQTGSKILGGLFFQIASLLIALRLHFAYFMVLEKSMHAKSSCTIALAALQQSLQLTSGKFAKLFFIVLFTQIFSVVFVLAEAFDISVLWSPFIVTLFYCITMLLTILATPLFMLMYARAYVLLTR